jgi:hypothetical protein
MTLQSVFAGDSAPGIPDPGLRPCFKVVVFDSGLYH